MNANSSTQVKLWSRGCELVLSSGHHHGSVKAILVAKSGLSPEVWTGSADGIVYVWRSPVSNTEVFSGGGEDQLTSFGKSLKGPTERGVTAMCFVENHVWVGYDDGKMRAFDRKTQLFVGDMAKHKITVSTLSCLGDNVWSGSADHYLIAWNAKTREPLFSMGDQGGYVRFCSQVGWALW
jgi:WD40 repeat protein